MQTGRSLERRWVMLVSLRLLDKDIRSRFANLAVAIFGAGATIGSNIVNGIF